MRIADFTLELHGSSEVTLNGVNVLTEGKTLHMLEEAVFLKQLTPQQQWAILCEMRKMLARMESAYNKGRVLRGEITEGDAKTVTSGAQGIRNVLPRLNPNNPNIR